MIRQVFERGLASLVARWMLEGGADAVFARIEKAGALKPEDLARLRAETVANLNRVREEGAPYADSVVAAWREIAGHLPDLHTIARMAGSTIASVAARSAETAAVHAQEIADRLAAQRADSRKASEKSSEMNKKDEPEP